MSNRAYPSQVWYVCKFCKRAYQHSDGLWNHKKENHMEAMLEEKKKKLLATAPPISKSPKNKNLMKSSVRKKQSIKRNPLKLSSEQAIKQDENSVCNTASLVANALSKGQNDIENLPTQIPKELSSPETEIAEIIEDLFSFQHSPVPEVPHSEEEAVIQNIINIDTSMYDMDETTDGVLFPCGNVYLCDLNGDSQTDETFLEISYISTEPDCCPSLNDSIILEDGLQDSLLESYNFEPYERFDYRQDQVEPDCYGSWRCPNCDEECINQFQLEFHQSRCTLYRCNLCIRTFTRRRYLDTHLSSIHNDENPRPVLRSPFDGSESDTSSMTEPEENGTISAILLSKPSSFHCRKCNATFPTRNELAAHLPAHRSDSKLECQICHELFGSRKRLMLHRRKHSQGLSPSSVFRCHRCPAVFKNRSQLASHHPFHRRSYISRPAAEEFTDSENVNANVGVSPEFISKLGPTHITEHEQEYLLIQHQMKAELSSSGSNGPDPYGISAAVRQKYAYILNKKGPFVLLERLDCAPSSGSASASIPNSETSAACAMSPGSEIGKGLMDSQPPPKLGSFTVVFSGDTKLKICRTQNLEEPKERRNQMSIRYKQRYTTNRRQQLRIQKLRDFYTRRIHKNKKTVALLMDTEETSILSDSSVEVFHQLPSGLRTRPSLSTTNSVISSSESVISSISSSLSSSDSALHEQIASNPFPIIILHRLSPSLLKKYNHHAHSEQIDNTVIEDTQAKFTTANQTELESIPEPPPPQLLPAFSCWLCDQTFGQLSDIEHHLRISHGVYSIVIPKLPKFNGNHDVNATIISYLIENHGVSEKQVSKLVNSVLYACIECELDLNLTAFKLHLHYSHKQEKTTKSNDTTITTYKIKSSTAAASLPSHSRVIYNPPDSSPTILPDRQNPTTASLSRSKLRLKAV